MNDLELAVRAQFQIQQSFNKYKPSQLLPSVVARNLQQRRPQYTFKEALVMSKKVHAELILIELLED